jgi:zinc protease
MSMPHVTIGAMSRRWFLALALACASLLATPKPALADEAEAPRGVPVQELTTPGGLSLWLVSDSTVPMLVVRAAWQAGSVAEPAALTGVSQVTASMLTEGAGDLDSNAFKVRLEELNMGLSFSAGWDWTTMTLYTLTASRPDAVELARLALTQPRFDPEPLQRIQRQLVVGIRQRETNPSFIANLAMDQALIAGHPYATRLTLEGVSAITQDALRARWREQFTRASLRVTVVGDISAEEATALVDRLFGELPAGSGAETVPPVTIADAAAAPIVRLLPQPQSLVLFAAPGIQDTDPDWISLFVANHILGSGDFTSRLMTEVREERGLVYGVSTSPSVRQSSAFIRGSAQTENADVAAAIATIRETMAAFAAEGPTQEEVDMAILYLTGSFPLSLDSNTGIAGVLSGYQTAGRSADYVNRRNTLIQAVTREDVARAARRFFYPDAYTFVIVGQPEGLSAAP